jgi:putative ABC transport system permease protein
MNRMIYELTESIRMAMAQIRANKMRSALTALGVVIGILAVTLMGTAIRGVDIGFNNSLAMLGSDVLHVEKWPWITGDDWWMYVNRPIIKPDDAVKLSRIIDATPNSELDFAVFVHGRGGVSVKAGSAQHQRGRGLRLDRGLRAHPHGGLHRGEDVQRDRERRGPAGVRPGLRRRPGPVSRARSSIGQTVIVKGQPFRVIGVLAKQGSFLGLFSFDDQMLMPLGAYRKYFGIRNGNPEIQVKVKDKTRMAEATRRAHRRHAPRARPGPGGARQLHDQHPGRVQGEAGPDQAGDRARGALRDRARPLCRRDRDHEHHVREREGAHQGDRDAQGPRGPPASRSCCSS